MGLYQRKDSPFWWFILEGTQTRASTGVPVQGGSSEQNRELRRQAETIYAARKTAAAMRVNGLAAADKPRISYQAFSEWFEEHEIAHHRSASQEASMLRRLAEYFGRFESLADIDREVVQEWMTTRRRRVKPGTVNRELDVLKRLFLAAVPKYLETSPIAGLRRFRVDETDPRLLTYDEERRLLDAASPADQAWLMTALDTLLRLSSVILLKWDQVKFDRDVIVPLNAKVSLDTVPMSKRVALALKSLSRSSPFVFSQFHDRGHGPTAAKNRAIRRFDELCQKADIPHGRKVNGVTFHCLRHTGATRALQDGASVRTVMKLGGWKSEHMVMRYVHAADSDVRKAANSIGRKNLRLA